MQTCEDQGMVTCPNGICEESLEDCPDTSCESGYIDDCSGDGDCCPESWVGDGYADCEDQAYGCDLTCYDNDGGDCGGRDDNSSGKVGQMYPSRLNADFTDAIIIPTEARDVDGYFVYRDGAYITFTDELGYADSDINAGSEYCYHVTAVYEEGQSGPSNTACATGGGDTGLYGDINGDGVINVQDLILVVNMILGTSEPNYSLADLNDDGIINILDVITLVNLVLGSRTIDMSENIGTDAVIYKTANSVSISANGNIAGIQLTVSANNLQINENIPMTVESNLVGDQHIILMYGLNGETFSGDKIQLFTASEDYKISSIIAANILSKAMNIEQRNGLLPETFELSQNFPNPFNPSTDIQFTVGKDALVSLNIYDIQGRLVSSLIDNYFYSAGSYKMNWDGKNQYGTQVPSGMYLYKLESSNQIITRKMVLMK